MKIHFINVGYGDSILIESEKNGENFNILIDGGEPYGEQYGKPQRTQTVDFLKTAGVSKIDILIVTHLHADHVGGLADVVRLYPVGELWCNLLLPSELEGRLLEPYPTYHPQMLDLISAINIYNDIYCRVKSKGKIVELTDAAAPLSAAGEMTFRCLGPDKAAADIQKKLIGKIYDEVDAEKRLKYLKKLFNFANRTSIVLKLDCCGKNILLGADCDASFWNGLMEKGDGLKSDIFKLPHHGRSDSITVTAARAIDPDYVVVCVSNDCEDDCPSQKALDCFERSTAQIFFTDGVNIPSRAFVPPRRSVSFEIENGTINCL